jgi:hypothetical protein
MAWLMYSAHDVHFLNCDSYNNCDSLTAAYPGNDGSGFQFINWDDPTTSIYFKDCRAWNCGDQGFALGDAGYIEYDNCWAWNNGQLQGGGHGFKLGWMGMESATPQVVVKNCISVYNRESGFTENGDPAYPSGYLTVYNNTSYRNGLYGFYIYNTGSDNAHELNRILKNNISYGDVNGAVYVASGALYTHDHNTWDGGVTVTNADFLSVDSTGISAARQADGSLPNNNCYNNFLRLASSSDLIDAGVDVGNGDDIGFDQYSAPVDPIDPVVIYTNSVTAGTTTATTGGNVIDDGGGTVTARGVAYGSSANPTIAGSHTSDGTGTGTFISNISGLTANTTYHVRAYATNEAGTAYGADVPFTTTSQTGLSGDFVFGTGADSNKSVWVKVGGVWYIVIK